MLNYRADIDGLRTLAVLLVLFYHIDLPFVTGGFIGVDVFFTISGFLITSIIVKQIDAGTFSFKSFYTRRAFRLIPAFLFLVISVLVAGWLLLPPIAFSQLIESSLAASLFVSNFYFFFEQGGYFATASHELPLLHTWSLAVEEQFYLIMPVAFVLLYKFKRANVRLYIVLAAFLGTAAFSHLLTMWSPSIAYFFVGSRFAEFLIGSLLAIYIYHNTSAFVPKTSVANALFIVGISTLIACSTLIDKKTLFPGLVALIPCLATALIIYSGTNIKSIGYKVLGIKPIVLVGFLSYSLYLWHWPIVAFLKYYNVSFSWWVQGSIVVSSFLFAYISWRYVETYFRSVKRHHATTKALVLYIAPAVGLILLLQLGKGNQFYPQRFDTNIVNAEKAIKSMPDQYSAACHTKYFDESAIENCRLGSDTNAETTAILWGDSHANHFVGFIDELGKEQNMVVTNVTMGNCPPALELHVDYFGARQACIEKNRAVYDYIAKNKPDIIYLAAAWGGYFKAGVLSYQQMTSKEALIAATQETIAKLTELQIKVKILKMIPRMPRDDSACYLKNQLSPMLTSITECSFENVSEQAPLAIVYEALSDAKGTDIELLGFDDLICTGARCKSYLDNMPAYRDSNHLNLLGSRALGLEYLKKHAN